MCVCSFWLEIVWAFVFSGNMGNLFVIRLWKRLGHFWERMVYKRKRLRGWELEKESGMLLGQKGNPSWQPKLLSQTF